MKQENYMFNSFKRNRSKKTNQEILRKSLKLLQSSKLPQSASKTPF